MLFNSLDFILLLVVSFFIYYSNKNIRLYVLLAANILFYAVTGMAYLALFMGVAFITYYCAKKLYTTHTNKYFVFPLILNILNLIFFKYAIFLTENLSQFLGLNLNVKETFLSSIILPVGISFYTFQLIAYIVDVKKGTVQPVKSFVEFYVFISFFGQLIAGPIMRANEFMPQISNIQQIRTTSQQMRHGVCYILLGFTKKILLADKISPYVNSLFSDIPNLTQGTAWIAVLLFAFQIYFDFSAYSQIALGVGKLFGLELAINFKTPYISASPAEFWKRWHITLSSFIRDYIYIPLGGSKKGKFRIYLNLIFAMTISGIWHGAAWPFILWGLYHGLLSCGHKFYTKLDLKFKKTWIYPSLSIFSMFIFTNIGWVFFRSPTISDGLLILKKLLTFDGYVNKTILFGFVACALLYLSHLAEYFLFEKFKKLDHIWMKVPVLVRIFSYSLVVTIILLFTSGTKSEFIYFQF